VPATVADPLEVLLRGWGAWAQRTRGLTEEDREYIERSKRTRSHTLAVAREFAPGNRKLSKIAQRRGGQRLREITGQPEWATEPMRCVETRTSKIDTPHDIPAHVRRVESAVLQLHLHDAELARVVRIEYETEGTQADKAQRLELEHRRYRDRLALARTWLHGRLGIS
jgi:hypothetical protein